MSIYICQICFEEKDNYRKLSKHIRDKHKDITIQKYYENNIDSRKTCIICDLPTKFGNLGTGYRLTCSAKCACIMHRQNLKNNPEKYNAFKEKVISNQTNIWANRTEIEKNEILKNTHDKWNEQLSKLNSEEKRKLLSRYYKCSEEKIKQLNETGRLQCYQNWKNGLSGFRKTHKGNFKPKNPDKYKGNLTNIFFRSNWERRLMVDLDEKPNVLWWSSEELIIRYVSPKDGRVHRYFPDFVMHVKEMTGKETTYLLEVKPKKETKPPEVKKRKTKTFLAEQMTFAINSAKWAAAERFCELHGWKFRIVTEDDLFPKRKKK